MSFGAGGPGDLDDVGLGALVEAEVHAEVVLRVVAAAAAHFVDLSHGLLELPDSDCGRGGRGDGDAGADAGAIALLADEAELDPVAGDRLVSQRRSCGRRVDAVDDDVHGAVVVVVTEGAAAGGDGVVDAGAGEGGDLFKLAVAQVAVDVLMLGVGGVEVGAVDLRVDVAVGDEDVEPAIVVEVDEADAPAEIAGVEAEAGEVGVVFKGAVAEVEVEGVGVAGEVGLDDVEQAVAVEVADGDAHAGLRLAVGRVGDAGFDGQVFEGAVLLVLIEGGGGGVVGDVDVGPAVVVEIGDDDGEAVGADGVFDAGLFWRRR